MNIFKSLPFAKSKDDAEPEALTPEEIRKQNIEFHRNHVRNGPSNFRTPTNGQIRRAQIRKLKGQTKRARRKQVDNFFEVRREAAILRGMLQHVGLLPFSDPAFTPAPRTVYTSSVYLISAFADAEGTVEVTADLVLNSFQSALNRYETLVGAPITRIDEDYVLPVSVASA